MGHLRRETHEWTPDMADLSGTAEERAAWDCFRAAILRAERDPSPTNLRARDQAKKLMLAAMGGTAPTPAEEAA